MIFLGRGTLSKENKEKLYSLHIIYHCPLSSIDVHHHYAAVYCNLLQKVSYSMQKWDGKDLLIIAAFVLRAAAVKKVSDLDR